MDTQIVLNQMLILLCYIFLGFLLCKIHIFNEDFTARLTKLIIYVSMPSMILASVLEQEGPRDMQTLSIVALTAAVMYLVLPGIAYLVALIFHVKPEYKGIYMFMTIYSNVGFMGFPVLDALYGPTAVFYAAIFNIVFNVSAYTFGIALMNYKRDAAAVRFDWRNLLNPGISLSVFAIIVYILNISFPKPIESALASLGNMTTPLAMMVIGSTLGTMKREDMVNDKKAYAYILFRQFVLPLLLFPIIKLCVSDELIRAVTFVIIAMPVANSAVLFANLYHHDVKLATKGVFVSTLLSILSIPLLTWLCL